MDVGLPDIDGREAVRILRKNGFKAPIIMLTGHDTDSDTILGLESGANDYVTKPFRFAVLLARIRAQLRQHEASEDAIFAIGPYTFQPSTKLLLNPKGNKVRLTEREASVLRYLYRANQRPVSREALLEEVWGYNSSVTTHTVETHIYRLRQKIERMPRSLPSSSPSPVATGWCHDRDQRPSLARRGAALDGGSQAAACYARPMPALASRRPGRPKNSSSGVGINQTLAYVYFEEERGGEPADQGRGTAAHRRQHRQATGAAQAVRHQKLPAAFSAPARAS